MHLVTPVIPGLVWAYQFHPGTAPCRRLAPDAGFQEMAECEGFFWLHLNLADQRVPGFLETIDGLDPAARASLTTHETHPSITVDEKSLYGTLVDFQREFDKETRDFGWLHFAVSDRFIITTRLQPLHSVDRLKAAVDKNSSRYLTPSHVFEGLVAEFQRSLINLVMETTEQLNAIEDLVYDSENRDERRRLAPLRRTVVRLHRHLRTVLTLMRRASAADHDEMLDIVSAHQHQTTACIHRRGVENLQARLPVAPAPDKGRRTAAPAQEPQSDRQYEKRHTHTDNGDDEIVSIGADKIFHHGDHPFRFFGFLVSWTINIAVVLIV